MAPGSARGQGASEIVTAPDGSVVVGEALEGRFVRLRPDGSLDRAFGRSGRLVVGELAGAEGLKGRFFHAANVAIDGRGRLLVFGQQIDNNNPVEVEEEAVPRSEIDAVVFRFDSGGRRDSGFGEGKGFIRSGFGLRLPGGPEVPRVSAMAGRVDSDDRPVLVAGLEAPFSGCDGHSGALTQPRGVVRLTRSGQPDPTFGGGDGVSPIDGSSSSPGLEIGAEDGLLIGAGRSGGSSAACRPGTTLYRLAPNGERQPTFGTAGVETLKALHLALLGPSGTILLARQSDETLVLARLRADGSRDLSFGRAGTTRANSPSAGNAHLWPAGVDRKGRILLRGWIGPRHSALVVGRLLANGKPDRSFGNRGWTLTRLPSRLALDSAHATLDRRGRLLVAGTVTEQGRGGEGFVVARYLLGR